MAKKRTHRRQQLQLPQQERTFQQAQVYRADGLLLEQPVALKFLPEGYLSTVRCASHGSAARWGAVGVASQHLPGL
jgi:hypothetical protein